jgi:hopanoid-associated phosphorylase
VSETGAGFVIAATGLRIEARIATRRSGVRAVSGGDAGRLDRLLRKTPEGGKAIISFGIAAGLAPGKPAGSLLVGREVVHGGKRYATDTVWSARIASLAGGDLVTFAGVDRPLASTAEKQSFHASTGAAAADMESHIAARVAAELRLPFAVLRAIADPAQRTLPPASLEGMRPDGTMDARAVLAALARRPGQLPALIRITLDMGRALAALLRSGDLLGPRLGFRDFS